MGTPTILHETPQELEDSVARIAQAWSNYGFLETALSKFLYEYVKGMVKGRGPADGGYSLHVRPPSDDIVKGQPKVLVAQVAENLRSALEYMIFELSMLNDPSLDEWIPQFPITKTKDEFTAQAKGRLKYLSNDQIKFVERQQPYHGNLMLSLLAEITNPSKHRRLASLRDDTDLGIYFAEITRKEEFADHFVYPMEGGMAIFAKPMDGQTFILLNKYDALPTLNNMIKTVTLIVKDSGQFFRV